MSDFVMPSLGADMEAGTLLDWYVKPGDTVKRGDIVALVDTSKAEIEVEIFEDGVIDELVVPVGVRVPVGAVLATLHPVGAKVAAAVGAPTEPAPPIPAPARRRPDRRTGPRPAAIAAERRARPAGACPGPSRGRYKPPTPRVPPRPAGGRATRGGPRDGHGHRTERRDHEGRRGARLDRGRPSRRRRQLRRHPRPSPSTVRPQCARRSAR